MATDDAGGGRWRVAARFGLAALAAFVAYWPLAPVAFAVSGSVAVLGGLGLATAVAGGAVAVLRSASLERLGVYALSVHLLLFGLWLLLSVAWPSVSTALPAPGTAARAVVATLLVLAVYAAGYLGAYALVYRGGYARARGWLRRTADRGT